MPDGAVIIAAITSCTNTSNPRNVVAAALLARNANKLGWYANRGSNLIRTGSKVAELYLKEAGLLTELEQLGFGIVALLAPPVTVCQAHPLSARNHRPRPVRDRCLVGQP